MVHLHEPWDIETDLVVVGAGACGMAASLAASEQGARVLLLEKSAKVGGNTALSQGMVPAAGTRFQKEAGVLDSPEAMAEDAFRKNGYTSDPELTLSLCRKSAELVEWLVDRVGADLRLVTDFKYPGYSQFRIHAPPSRTGLELVSQMLEAVKAQKLITLAADCPVRSLVTSREGEVIGVVAGAERPERVKSQKVILACNGFGANREMLEQYCPEIANGLYFNHPGNTGEGIRWGMELGAAVQHMDAFQGHASIAHPHGILVTWAVIMSGGIQVNKAGRRFGDETRDYSAYTLKVLSQPEGLAFDIFGEGSYRLAVAGFEGFRELIRAGAVRRAESVPELAGLFGLNADNLENTLRAYNAARARGVDEFGREQFGEELIPPLYGVQVTGALLHTQGGLRINTRAQALKPNGSPIPNLYAGGGVAVGVSGPGASGYLSGNGLLTALGWGKVAGEDAASSLQA
ncbi:MAG: FAD-dependent oxidoreductase [Chloroflexi bacterium]|nr:FAD-dependent oxidoreductase [Chloroflexota bacterium]